MYEILINPITLLCLGIIFMFTSLLFFYFKRTISVLEKAQMDQARVLQGFITNMEMSQQLNAQRMNQMNQMGGIPHQHHQVNENSQTSNDGLIDVSDDDDSDSDSDSDSEKENVYSANIQDRDREFYNSLTPYKEKYGKDILRPFYEYWSERGDKDVKMKFEKQKSFSVPARLSTWARNDKKWDKTKETKIGRQTHATIESNQQGW